MLVKKEEEVSSDFPTPISTIETFFNYCVISLFLGVFYSIKKSPEILLSFWNSSLMDFLENVTFGLFSRAKSFFRALKILYFDSWCYLCKSIGVTGVSEMIDEFPNMMIIVLKISFSFSSTCHTRRKEKKSEMSIFNPFFLISSSSFPKTYTLVPNQSVFHSPMTQKSQ